MSKYFKATFAGILFMAGLVFFNGGYANATGTGESQPAAQPTAAPEATYEYKTPKGCSLSLLARRSLQLYDQADDKVSLSEAQIIYAETNIVSGIGPRLLNVDEVVKINKSLVEDFAKKSQDLSAAKIAAWQSYAKRANFKLDDINPVSGSATSSSQTDDSTQSKAAEGGDQAKNSDKAKQPTPWYWWVIGGSTLGILYYLLSAPRTPSKK